MIHFDPTTNTQRAQNGATITDLHTEWVIEAGSILTPALRAEIGRAMAEIHSGGLVEEDDVQSVASDLLIDLFHCADGHIRPMELTTAAICEQRATVSMAGNLLALGEHGRIGRIACALAAVLDYTEAAGLDVEATVNCAHDRWREEVEAERFALIRATRRH
ncbi:hypothetical protein ACFV6G_35980 [Streptomyces lavendulae]|uniref:hypothetical protein n=1 Tax=Streptomyces lavendulae TaxID=1914 RepID=UPI003679F7B2